MESNGRTAVPVTHVLNTSMGMSVLLELEWLIVLQFDEYLVIYQINIDPFYS